MPCDSSYMNPHHYEKEISKVACLLDELAGLAWVSSYWDGYHPKVYNKCSPELGDMLTQQLCSALQHYSEDEIRQMSLEMQIWWRDHKRADEIRLQREKEAELLAHDRAAALAKLSPYERDILGLSKK